MALAPAAYTPHTLLTFGGALNEGTDVEQWQCGIRVGMFGGSTSDLRLNDLTAYLNSIHGGLQTAWWAATQSSVQGGPASFARIDWLKAANIGADGKYAGATDTAGGPNPAQYLTTLGAGYSNAGNLPGFVTLAVSFHTAAATKYARHGRVYLPLALAAQASGSARVPSGTQTNAANLGAAILTAIAKPVSSPANNTGAIRPIIASRHGEVAQINEIRVGDVLDVQRRRKKKLKESYLKQSWS